MRRSSPIARAEGEAPTEVARCRATPGPAQRGDARVAPTWPDLLESRLAFCGDTAWHALLSGIRDRPIMAKRFRRARVHALDVVPGRLLRPGGGRPALRLLREIEQGTA